MKYPRRTKQLLFKKNKTRKIGGLRRVIDVTIPEEFASQITEILQLDNSSENITLNLHEAQGLNLSLSEIMLKLGATEELLNTKCFAFQALNIFMESSFIVASIGSLSYCDTIEKSVLSRISMPKQYSILFVRK